MKLMGRVVGVILLALSMSTLSLADEVNIPFPIHVKPFIKECKKQGFDLNDVDGFVENKGGKVIIYTYKPVSIEQLEKFKMLTWKHIRK